MDMQWSQQDYTFQLFFLAEEAGSWTRLFKGESAPLL